VANVQPLSLAMKKLKWDRLLNNYCRPTNGRDYETYRSFRQARRRTGDMFKALFPALKAATPTAMGSSRQSILVI
jgi:hypothetical protein